MDNLIEIDGLEVKKALESLKEFLDKGDLYVCVPAKNGIIAWKEMMRKKKRKFREEVTGDGSPFVRIEVVKAMLTDTILKEHPGMKQLKLKLSIGEKKYELTSQEIMEINTIKPKVFEFPLTLLGCGDTFSYLL